MRNSGATVVAEGAGKYAFEYMTAGTGVVPGAVGAVLGSGLSGGVVFVHDPAGEARRRLHADAGATPVLLEERGRLLALLDRHQRLTGSPVAGRLLGRWGQAVLEFIAVRPVGEARRVLAPAHPAAADSEQAAVLSAEQFGALARPAAQSAAVLPSARRCPLRRRRARAPGAGSATTRSCGVSRAAW